MVLISMTVILLIPLDSITLHISVCKILQTIDQITPEMRWLRFLDLVDLVILFLFI